MRFSALLLTNLLLWALSPLSAQVLLQELSDARQAVAVGDVDADGVQDLVVVSLAGDVSLLLSGSGQHAFTLRLDGDPNAGRTLLAPGDLDGDGTPDLLLGLPDSHGGAGQVRALSLSDGSTLAQWSQALPGQRLGASLALLPDLDGDGVPEWAAGAPGSPDQPAFDGRVLVLSLTAPAQELLPFDLDPPAAGRRFGHALGVGDVDGDGQLDLVVAMPGVPGSVTTPRVQAFALATLGSAQAAPTLNLAGPWAGWGESLALPGDVNRDGADDLLLGAPFGVGESQADPVAQVRSGTDGSLLATLAAPASTPMFGLSVAGPGDINLDGVPDLLVGGPGDPSQGALGRALVFSGSDGSVLFEILGASLPDAAFASNVARLTDLTGDGTDEFVVDDGPSGSLRIYSALGVIEDLGLGLAGAAGTPRLRVESTLLPGTALRVELDLAPADAPLFALFGFGFVAAPLLGGTMVPETIVVLSGPVTDAAGRWLLQTRWPPDMPSATLYVQVWLPDATGPQGVVASNGLGLSPP